MMQCSNCGFDNPAGMKFCGACGAALKIVCPDCTFENPFNFKYCGNCGTALAGEPDPTMLLTGAADRPAPAVTRVRDSRSEAERRQLTVMFCDLVGSTALSQQLDPEELHQVVGAYQAVCGAVIDRFEGHVAQYLGDGLLVYFGYPQAHEDDARRAVRTGLGIIEAIARLGARLRQDQALNLSVRIGVHTGLVVVGQVGSGTKHEQLALGDTPNIAARLQGTAAPNTVVISASTYQLVTGFFTVETLGAQALAGVTHPVTLYRVLTEQNVANRLEATGELTPLVGRQQELNLLLGRWEQVKESAGQVVSLNGEGGIGKSRLIHSLKERLKGESLLWLETHCSPYYQNSALYPLITLLQQVLEFEPADDPDQRLGKIEAALARRGRSGPRQRNLAEAVPLIADLLSVPLDNDYAPANLPPARQKQLTLEILLAMLLEATIRRPVIFVMEDLHWVDPSTLEFINLTIDQGSTARLLVLFTFRPTFSPTWPARSHMTHLTVGRLTRNQIETMAVGVTKGKRLPAELLRQVIAKTDGVPLFVEELLKMALELNLLAETDDRYELSAPLPLLEIPATLQDSLMARLDRLATVKEVAQLAATVGREFSYDLLHAVSDLDEATLRQDLAKLVKVEILHRRGLPPQATYIFKHALVQEAAYRSLLRSTRQQYHLKIGQVLAAHFPDIAERQPEVVAHHYTAADFKEEAIRYWGRAGERAINHSANLEAIEHLSRGLALLDRLPAGPPRIEQQLKLTIALGVPYLMTKGYASPAVEQVYGRAWKLCQQLGQSAQPAPALFGLWVFYLVRADYQMAEDLGDRLMVSAQWSKNSTFLVEAHQVQGINHFYRGRLAAAQEHLEQALTLSRPPHRSGSGPGAYSGANSGAACLAHLALTLWLTGYPEQARRKIEAAMALAAELAHPYSQVFVHSFAAWLHQYRREGQPAQKQAEAAIEQATEQGFALLLHFSRIFRGWSLADQGAYETGIGQIRAGLDAYLATGAELGRFHFMALLAEASGRAGQVETGLRLVNDALSAAGARGERFYEAELYRLKGELLLSQTAPQTEAEECFRQAMAVAQEQTAKSFELRAATSLGRLWLEQGRAAEARRLLAPIYEWFGEGFETRDLKTAKMVLAQLD